MSVIADLIRAGVDPDLVARVHEEIVAASAREPARDLSAERRRSVDRERKQALRDADKASAEIRRNPQTSAEIPSLDKESPHTPKEINPNITTSLRSVDAAASDPMDEDPKSVLFSQAALGWLCKAGEMPERSARSLIGKWLSELGGDAHAAVLLGMIRDTKRERKSDPVAWITAMVQGRGAASRGRPRSQLPKVPQTLRLAAHVIGHFKAQGPGWQTRINAVLEKHVVLAERKARREQEGRAE